MPHTVADYLFLASLFVPTAGILVGVIYLLVPVRGQVSAPAVEAKAHG